jgi:hypothetical protein
VRKIVLLLCILLMPSISFAQSKQASWTNLSALHAGQKIQITGTDSKKHSGTFLSFTDTSISYHDASGDQTIQKLNVSSVRNLENHHRLRNALIGAAIGGGAAGGITAGAEKNHDPIGRGVDSVEAALGGIVAGALIGAFLPTHSLVYDVNSH